MERDKKRKRPATSEPSLEPANKRIASLLEKCLPTMPYLLEMPKKHQIIQRTFPIETMNAPPGWTRAEYENMQYMTFVSESERGYTTTRGAWEGDMETWGLTPEQLVSRSSSGTPNPSKKPVKKFALKDYRVFKETGVMPPSSLSKTSTTSPTPDPLEAAAQSGGPNPDTLSSSLAKVLSTEPSAKPSVKPSAEDVKKVNLSGTKKVASTSKDKPAEPSQASSSQVTADPTINGNAKPISRKDPVATTASTTTASGMSESASSQKESKAVANGITKNSLPAKPVDGSVAPKSLPANGATASSVQEKSVTTSRKTTESATKSGPVTNGTASRYGLDTKQSNKGISRSKPEAERSTVPEHPTFSKSVIVKRTSPENGNLLGIMIAPGIPLKRPSPPSEVAPPEKRAKTDTGAPSKQSKAPANPPGSLPRKPDPSGLPPKPKFLAASSSSTPSSRPKADAPAKLGKDIRNTGSSKPGNSRTGTPRPDGAKSEKSRDLPPMLSPLRANFEGSPLSEPPSNAPPKSKKQEEKSSAVTKAPVSNADKEKTASKKPVERSSSPELPATKVSRQIPRLLSPDLPPVVEEALAQLQTKKKKHETVGERHESVRLPNAPGVARKTIKPKASRKTVATDPPAPVVSEEPEEPKDSSIVKLKYKKRQAKDVERLLKCRPKPWPQQGDAEKKPTLEPSALPKDDNSSDSDVPLARAFPKAAATTGPKKRPAESTPSEPASKRAKAEKPDAGRSSSTTQAARKSLPAARRSTPLPNAGTPTPTPLAHFGSPGPKNVLSTPKKGDGLKSVAMRKVDSSDGLARTPQPTMTSAPASAEKSRMTAATSESRHQPSTAGLDKSRSDERKLQELALKIKRKMDEILKSKVRPRPPISEKDRKLGVATFIESLVVYMNAYYLSDRLSSKQGNTRNPKPWLDLNSFRAPLELESAEIPAFHALACQLGAICQDQLERSLLANAKSSHKDPGFWEAVEKNNRSKNLLWVKAEEEIGALAQHAPSQILTPGSDIKQITTYAIGILTSFSRKNNTGWKKDPEFSSVLF